MHSIKIYGVPFENVKTFHVSTDDNYNQWSVTPIKGIHWNVTPIVKKFNVINDKTIKKFLYLVAKSRKNSPKVFTIGEFIINKNEHFGIHLHKITIHEDGNISIRRIKRKS